MTGQRKYLAFDIETVKEYPKGEKLAGPSPPRK